MRENSQPAGRTLASADDAALEKILTRARHMITVRPWIPKLFHRFFLRQGAFNRAVLEAVSALAQRQEERQTQLQHQLQELHATREAAQRVLSEIATQPEQLRQLFAGKDRSDAHLRELQSHADRTDEVLRKLREQLLNDDVFTKGELSRYGALIQRWADGVHVGSSKAQPAVVTEAEAWSEHRLDSHYLSFEHRFRGSFAEIKERVRYYLPHMHEANAGAAGRPILDVGCGRGEWLELLRENGLEAAGVDLSEAMVAQCHERKLAVQQADALAYLRALPDDSQGAVTAFHIIEHLPLDVFVAFFAEVRRVLAPGGIAVFESPNCKNLTVGASFFYVDPTHRNPVFPETAEFLLGAQGFEKTRIEYLSPVDTSLIPGSEEVQPQVLRDLLYGPRDFAVIGSKPGPTL